MPGSYFRFAPLCSSMQVLPPPHLELHPSSTLVDRIYMGSAERLALQTIVPGKLAFQSEIVPDNENNLLPSSIPIRPIPLKNKNSYNNSGCYNVPKKNSKILM
jgi:hypothetical protein